MGAVAVSNVVPISPVGRHRTVKADVVFSSSYATSGDTVALSALGLTELYHVYVDGGEVIDSTQSPLSGAFTPNTHGIQVVLGGTLTAPKLLAYVGAAGSAAQVSAATNLSAISSIRMEFRGV